MSIELASDRSTLDAATVAAICESAANTLPSNSRIGISAESPLAFALGLLIGKRHDLDMVALPHTLGREAAIELADSLKLQAIVTGFDAEKRQLKHEVLATAPGIAQGGGLSIFTSGTSGAPKLARHAWKTIAASGNFVPERLHNLRWYLAYSPASFAGLQVLFSAAASGGALYLPAQRDVGSHVANLREWRPDVISATPTWWRLVVGSWNIEECLALKQATLGGEVVNQMDLDIVDQCFAPENLTHIYASTEAGTAIVVSDRQAGFPAAWLTEERVIPLRIVDGLLHLKTSRGMLGYEGVTDAEANDGWINTNDIAEVRGDRCFLLGRADGLLNVGGAKVRPEEVEAAISKLPDVVDCIVYARKNSLTGTVLAADILLRADSELDVRGVKRNLAHTISAGKVPGLIRLVERLEPNANGKKQRS